MNSGKYIYFNDGQLTDVSETWRIETLNHGRRVTRSERRAPSFGSEISVEALHNAHGEIASFKVEWRNTSPNAVSEANARYTLGENIDATWTIEGKTQHENLATPAKLAVMPLMRIFTGNVIRQIVAHGGEASVLVPNITNPANHDLLLSPLLETRQARYLHDEIFEGETCAVYQYTGGNYDEAARFWLNAAGILARYTFQNWDVRLSNFPA